MTYTWDYGIDLDNVAAGNYRGSFVTGGDPGDPSDWSWFPTPMDGLREGLDIEVTRYRFNLRLFSTTGDVNFCVYDVSGNDWTLQGQKGGPADKTGWSESNTQVKSIDMSSNPLAYTIGSETWFGTRCARSGAASTSPGGVILDALTSVPGMTQTRTMIHSSNSDPDTFTAGTDATIATPGDHRLFKQEIRFTTDQVMVTDIVTPDDNAAYLIPALVSGHAYYSIKIEDVVVTAGNSLTINLLDTTSGSALPAASETAVVDMGATDQMTFDGANVTGITAGDTYDLIITIRLSDGAIKFAWINKDTGEGPIGSGTDFTTVDHKSAVSGTTRDLWASNSNGPPRLIQFVGTATIGRLQVAAFPIVAHMDSQGLDNGPLEPITGRLLPALDDYFEAQDNPQMWWYNGPGSGGRQSANTAFAAGTITHLDTGDSNVGVYDVSEIHGRHIIGTAINDFANSTSSLLANMQAIAGEFDTNGDTVVFMDIPPASSAAISAAESGNIRDYSADVLSMVDYNDAVFGVEVSWSKFNGGQDSGGIYEPKNIGTWFNADELHYLAAGAAIKADSVGAAILYGGLRRQTSGPIGSTTSWGYRHKDIVDETASNLANINASDLGGVEADTLAEPQAAVE